MNSSERNVLPIMETSYKITDVPKREAHNYMLKPLTSLNPKIRKIKLGPAVVIVEALTSRSFVSKFKGEMKYKLRIKPSPCYPIATSSILMLPAGSRQKTKRQKKDFQCTYCFRLFQWKGSLNRHLRVHHSKNRLTCVHCGQVFKEKADLHEHRRKHSADKRYRCIICNKGFNQNSHLRRHLRTHSGSRPFKCTQCSKAFARASCLTGHIRTHTGERPYKCGQCSKAFTQNHNLRRHLRTHSLRPYQCTLCQKLFSEKASLSRHLLLHNPVLPIDVKIESFLNHESDKRLQPNDILNVKNSMMYNSALPLALAMASLRNLGGRSDYTPGGGLKLEENKNYIKSVGNQYMSVFA